jgi:hypothetical protein
MACVASDEPMKHGDPVWSNSCMKSIKSSNVVGMQTHQSIENVDPT